MLQAEPVLMARVVARHQLDWVASGLRRAAAEAGVELSVSYSRRLAQEGLAQGADLGVTRLGAGVVIHTAPGSRDRRPVVVGYADPRGQWHRDGRRHLESLPTEHPGYKETPGHREPLGQSEAPGEGVGVEL